MFFQEQFVLNELFWKVLAEYSLSSGPVHIPSSLVQSDL